MDRQSCRSGRRLSGRFASHGGTHGSRSLRRRSTTSAHKGTKAPIFVIRVIAPRWTGAPRVYRSLAPGNVAPTGQRAFPRPIVVKQPDPRLWAPQVIQTRSGRLQSPWKPRPPIVVPYYARPRWTQPILLKRSLAKPSLGYRLTPIVVRVPRQLQRPLVVTTSPRGASRFPDRRPITIPHANVMRELLHLPWKDYQVIISSTGTISKPVVPTKSIIVRPPSQLVRPTLALIAHTSLGGFKASTLPIAPLFVRPPRPLVRPTQAILPAFRYLLASPAQHGPMPYPPAVFGRKWGVGGGSYGLIYGSRGFSTIIVRPPLSPPPSALPPDLIAACIAWLRTNPALVASFGDDPLTGTPKFFSDIAIRNTTTPYLEFSEPMEVEGYETIDYTRQFSSLASGTFEIQIRGLRQPTGSTARDSWPNRSWRG